MGNHPLIGTPLRDWLVNQRLMAGRSHFGD